MPAWSEESQSFDLAYQIPLKQGNTFLPSDQAHLGVKYNEQLLEKFKIDVDYQFLKSLKRDVDCSLETNDSEPRRMVSDYNLKLELKKIALKM